MVANAYSGAKDSVDGRAFSCTGEAHKNNLHGISGNSEVEVLCFVERSLHLERAKPVVCVRVCGGGDDIRKKNTSVCCWHTNPQRHRDTETQRHKHTETQREARAHTHTHTHTHTVQRR